jgi:hypothetical protein
MSWPVEGYLAAVAATAINFIYFWEPIESIGFKEDSSFFFSFFSSSSIELFL